MGGQRKVIPQEICCFLIWGESYALIQGLKLWGKKCIFSMRHLEEVSLISPWKEYCVYKQVNKGK